MNGFASAGNRVRGTAMRLEDIPSGNARFGSCGNDATASARLSAPCRIGWATKSCVMALLPGGCFCRNCSPPPASALTLPERASAPKLKQAPKLQRVPPRGMPRSVIEHTPNLPASHTRRPYFPAQLFEILTTVGGVVHPRRAVQPVVHQAPRTSRLGRLRNSGRVRGDSPNPVATQRLFRTGAEPTDMPGLAHNVTGCRCCQCRKEPPCHVGLKLQAPGRLYQKNAKFFTQPHDLPQKLPHRRAAMPQRMFVSHTARNLDGESKSTGRTLAPAVIRTGLMRTIK